MGFFVYRAPEANLSWIPAVDVVEEAERFVVRADLPGVDPKDVEITAEAGVLTLRGKRESVAHEEASYERTERVAGSFLRRFTLPDAAQTDAITARQVNGVLEVSIPKQPKLQPRRVEVQAA